MANAKARARFYHLSLLQEAGVLSSTIMSNPGSASMGKYARFYRVTDVGRDVISKLEQVLDQLGSEYDQYDIRRAISSSEVRNAVMNKLRVGVEKRSRDVNKNTNIVNLIREAMLKVGIEITDLEIYETEEMGFVMEFHSVSALKYVQALDTVPISGEVRIATTPIKFSALIKTDEEQKTFVQRLTSERAVLSHAGITGNKTTMRKFAFYNECVRLVVDYIACVLHAVFILQRR